MENQPQQCKCPFRNPIITREYGCVMAQEVTFREGPGITCNDLVSWQRCTSLFNALKTASLPAFDVADDLTEMPASVLSKIQFGGLAALPTLLQLQEKSIDNINELVATAMEKFGSVDELDFSVIVPIIKDYRMRKRRKV